MLPEVENQNIIINDDYEIDFNLRDGDFSNNESRINGDCYAELSKTLTVNDDCIVLDPDLGLAIEKLPEGKNAFGLWKLI